MKYLCKNCHTLVNESQYKKNKSNRDILHVLGALVCVAACFMGSGVAFSVSIILTLIYMLLTSFAKTRCPNCKTLSVFIPEDTPYAQNINTEKN